MLTNIAFWSRVITGVTSWKSKCPRHCKAVHLCIQWSIKRFRIASRLAMDSPWLVHKQWILFLVQYKTVARWNYFILASSSCNQMALDLWSKRISPLLKMVWYGWIRVKRWKYCWSDKQPYCDSWICKAWIWSCNYRAWRKRLPILRFHLHPQLCAH